MDPEGVFGGSHGDTLSLWWKPVKRAARYWVVVEKCDALQSQDSCPPVVDLYVNSTHWDMTSEDKFGACTFYHLKVVAQDEAGQRLMKETALLNKSSEYCNQHFHIILGVTVTLLILMAVGLFLAILYYSHKRPLEKLQRARSRVYSRLYSRDKYVRPYDKSSLVQDLEKMDLDSASLEDEFADLEKLAEDTIQRRTSQSALAVNRRRNR